MTLENELIKLPKTSFHKLIELYQQLIAIKSFTTENSFEIGTGRKTCRSRYVMRKVTNRICADLQTFCNYLKSI